MGERTLEGSHRDCAALTEPLAFVIAMMIDPEVVAHGLPPSLLALLGEEAPEERLLAELQSAAPRPLTGASTQQPTSAQAAAPKELSPLPAADAARLQFSLVGGGVLRAGPAPVPFGRLFGMTRVGPAWLSLAASAWAGAQVGGHSLGAGRGFRLSMGALDALLCVTQPSRLLLRISGCLGPTLMLRWATGEGFEHNQTTTLVSAGAAALLGGRFRITRGWGIAALLGAELGFSRSRLVYDSPEGAPRAAYRFPLVNFSVGVGPSFEY